ncbi:rRNA maturation RNase YbeY [Candidatus Parcubacteria bacterium]|nr:MAG: rRNA maturation RNase YbeY [Candidatus Parcubacteria bacterium]
MTKLEVEVRYLYGGPIKSAKFFNSVAEALIKAEGLKRIKVKGIGRLLVSLVFVSKEQSRIINKVWRHKNKPAKVLSFSFFEKAMRGISRIKEFHLGEIFIAIPKTKKSSLFKSKELERELTHYFVHAMLHLLGYDHEGTGRSFERDGVTMDKLERKILGKFFKEK